MTTPERQPGGTLFWAAMAVGATTCAIALYNLARSVRTHSLVSAVSFLGGAGVAHDFVWAPAVVLVGFASRRLPEVARRPVRVGLAVCAVTVLFTLPELHGRGRHPHNATVLPLDYARNVTATLAVVACLVVATVVARRVRRRTPVQ